MQVGGDGEGQREDGHDGVGRAATEGAITETAEAGPKAVGEEKEEGGGERPYSVAELVDVVVVAVGVLLGVVPVVVMLSSLRWMSVLAGMCW